MLVESRKFLVWSGLYIVFVSVLAISMLEWSFPVAVTDTNRNIVGLVLGIPCAAIAFATFLDGLVHIFESRRYAWLIGFVLLGFGGAYLYGFLVASRDERGKVAT